MLRELSSKGLLDRKLVTVFFMDKQIDVVLSSPYKRAIDTVSDFAEKKKMDIVLVEDFKERRVDSVWIEDFDAFCKKQWEDFTYKLSDGECLEEVQNRNISALKQQQACHFSSKPADCLFLKTYSFKLIELLLSNFNH